MPMALLRASAVARLAGPSATPQRLLARHSTVLMLLLLVLSVDATKPPVAASAPNGRPMQASAGEESCVQEEEPAMPLVRVEGELVHRPISNSLEVDGRTLHMRDLHDELQLTYVHNILSAEEIDQLIACADARNGWSRSPLKTQEEGATRNVAGAEKDDRRNSTSCPMIWPLAYRSRREELAANPSTAYALLELDLTQRISERVAAMFAATGLDISADYIEPLQLVRYQPSERFGPHHDYHATGKSSVQGEQRMFTFLLFGSTLTSEQEGETHFPLLDVAVSPKLGDGLVWANVDETGEPNERSLHEGRPPVAGEKIAINVWVADKPFDLSNGMEGAIRSG